MGQPAQSVDELQTLGYQPWLASQFAAPASVYPACLDANGMDWAQSQFFSNAMAGPDQLRQRMAFALHQIFVVSAVKVDDSHSYVPYLRTPQADAFSNYREVMQDIALEPAMGEFLDMVNNDKVDPKSGASPNENFARELKQLCTFGLAQLNVDGAPQLDLNNVPLPSYSQTDVTNFARVFTGWTYAPRPGHTARGHNSENYSGPMVFYDSNHDQGIKHLLNGVVLQQILTFDTGMKLIGAMSGILGAGLKNAAEIQKVLTNATALKTVFPNTGLGNQLKQAAQLLSVRSALGMQRQIFFCSQGGFDNHSDLVASQDNLFNELGPALAAFYQATAELSVANQMTTFTESEFGRTFNPSSTAGSDHAWGSHHLVLGGAVNGGQMYGKFPTLVVNGPDDAGNRGQWIPSTGLDQYASTMATWFGVQPGDLPTVFPNINNFPSHDLGFMKAG